MKPLHNIPHLNVSHRQLHPPRDSHHAADHKARLVNVGRYALSHGDWALVASITRLIQARGWRHA